MSDDKVLESANLFAEKCVHNRYLVNPRKDYVECAICGDHLNAIWVLQQLCNGEARAWSNLDAVKGLVEKTKEKLHCKCQHCKKMTRIYR